MNAFHRQSTLWRFNRWVIAVLLLLLSIPTASAAGVQSLTTSTVNAHPRKVTVGNPNEPGALGTAVSDAYAAGARTIVIRPGVYMIPSSDKDVIWMHGWQNAEVRAYGVTIITGDQPWPTAIFHLDHCVNVTIAGALLSEAKITAYQGKVMSVGKDAQGNFQCDWKPDAGYPDPSADGKMPGWANVVDARIRMLKLGLGDFYGVKWTPLGDGSYQVTGLGRSPNIAVGDWLVARRDIPIAIKVHLDQCVGCTVDNVSMMRNGFAPIFETGGSGDHIVGCKWLLGPKPQGATENPIVTNSADGVHSTGCEVGPDIEDCTMHGVFLDDCIAIHGSFSDVIACNGRELTVKGGANLIVGQPVIVCDKSGLFATAGITGVSANGDGSETVTTDGLLGATIGAKVYNPMACGAGYRIVHCNIGGTRSRGILAKGSDGLISDNTITHCGMSAVSLGPEFYWNEAGYVSHVVVSGNTIDGSGNAGYGGAAIWVHGDGAVGNSGIRIVGNRISSSYLDVIDIDWCRGAAITGNSIAGPRILPKPFSQASVIQISHASDLLISDNTLRNSAAYTPQIVVLEDGVIQPVNGVSNGVRVLP